MTATLVMQIITLINVIVTTIMAVMYLYLIITRK